MLVRGRQSRLTSGIVHERLADGDEDERVRAERVGRDPQLLQRSGGAPKRSCSTGWSETSSIGAPSPRARHAAVWAGGQMIVWGGSTIWTGTEVLIVGVTDSDPTTGAALLYHPETDRWRIASDVGQPSARTDFALVWSGVGRAIARGRPTASRWRSL